MMKSHQPRTVPVVDDAGGGRRGSRAVVSRELWEVLVSRRAIPLQQGRDLGGSLNLNLLVSRGDDQLVVRVHRPSVRPARLQDIQAVRDRLDSAGVPCAALVPARDGARWSQVAGTAIRGGTVRPARRADEHPAAAGQWAADTGAHPCLAR